MKKKVLRILLTLLIIAWMGLIFFFSSQTGPASASSSHSVLYLLGHILKSLTGHDLVAALSPAAFGFLEFIIRKCAHMFAYFILSILIMSLLFTYKKYPIRFKACISLLISFLYACSDELHQFFVGGRFTLAVSFLWIEFYILIGLFICIMPPFTLIANKAILLHRFF